LNPLSSAAIYLFSLEKATIEENDDGYYIEYGDRTKCVSTLETTDGKKIFDHTKPLTLMTLLAKLSTQDSDIILDFFSGSAAEIQKNIPAEYRSSMPVGDCLNIDIKMETGTGKTYVYTHTIYELHKRYGLGIV
jgi:hypothetical protein